MMGDILASSSGWEKIKVCVSSGEGFFVSFFLMFSCVFFVYLSYHHILKVTPLVQEKKPSVVIFIFSAQFASGTDHSEKPKTRKLISKSLITPLI